MRFQDGPSGPSGPLPVMFYIHGGGWLSGSGDLYGPEYLLDRDVILVTLNYRLGPLGTVLLTQASAFHLYPSQ